MRSALAVLCFAVAPVALYFACMVAAWHDCRAAGGAWYLCLRVLTA